MFIAALIKVARYVLQKQHKCPKQENVVYTENEILFSLQTKEAGYLNTGLLSEDFHPPPLPLSFVYIF